MGMSDNIAHALVLEHRGTDLSIGVEAGSYWHGTVALPHGDAVEVSRSGGAATVLEVWTRAGRGRAVLDEAAVRALVDLLRAAVD